MTGSETDEFVVVSCGVLAISTTPRVLFCQGCTIFCLQCRRFFFFCTSNFSYPLGNDRISHQTGKPESIQKSLGMGYVSSQEGSSIAKGPISVSSKQSI